MTINIMAAILFTLLTIYTIFLMFEAVYYFFMMRKFEKLADQNRKYLEQLFNERSNDNA